MRLVQGILQLLRGCRIGRSLEVGRKSLFLLPVLFILLGESLFFSHGAYSRVMDRDIPVISKEISQGPLLMMEPRKGSGLVCVMIAVPAGSAKEPPQLRGISHFLEHMVFDGSEVYSRKEISDWIDGSGAFLNAFTREEVTVYFALVPSSELEKILDILSQMLLHSTFPKNEIEKERKVITEEIRKDRDNKSSVMEAVVKRALYARSPIGASIAGTEETVAGITREDLIRYYRNFYNPELMRVYLLGDFEPLVGEKLVTIYFSRSSNFYEPEKKISAFDEENYYSTQPPVFEGIISEIADRELDEGLDILVKVPFEPTARNISRVLILSELLNRSGGPLEGVKGKFRLRESYVEPVVRSRLLALRFHFRGLSCDKRIVGDILEELETLKSIQFEKAEIENARVSLISRDMYNSEKFHYYIMLEGEKIALFGSGYLLALRRLMSEVKASECVDLARKTFSDMKFNGCRIHGCLSGAEAEAYKNSKVVTLPNGAEIFATEREGSEIFAVTFLFKDPVCLEKRFFPGAVRFLHALFKESESGKRLASRLSSLGAEVKWGDNPYIPFDDYLVNPSFSFITLLSPAKSSKDALKLLVSYLENPKFSIGDIEKVKGVVKREMVVRMRSPGFLRNNLIFQTLFPSEPYSYPLYPLKADLEKVTTDLIEEIRSSYISSGSMHVSVVSPMEPEEAITMVKGFISSIPEGEVYTCTVKSSSFKEGMNVVKNSTFRSAYLERLILVSVGEKGISTCSACAFSVDELEEYASMIVAAQVLSRRMQERIREEHGLAYSTGCTIIPTSQYLVVRAYAGVSPENARIADSLIVRCMEGLKENPPSADEIELAKKRALGRRLRRELSSDTQAYQNGVDWIVLGKVREERELRDLIRVVTPDDVLKVAGELSNRKNIISIDIIPQ